VSPVRACVIRGYAPAADLLVIAGVPVSIRRGPLAIAFGEPLESVPGEEPQAFALRLQEASFALARQAEAALGTEGANR